MEVGAEMLGQDLTGIDTTLPLNRLSPHILRPETVFGGPRTAASFRIADAMSPCGPHDVPDVRSESVMRGKADETRTMLNVCP